MEKIAEFKSVASLNCTLRRHCCYVLTKNDPRVCLMATNHRFKLFVGEEYLAEATIL